MSDQETEKPPRKPRPPDSEETRRKKSEGATRKWQETEFRNRNVAARTGTWHHTPEFIEQIADVQRRIYADPETGPAKREEWLAVPKDTWRGKKRDEETKQKIGKALTGRKNSPETRERKRQAQIAAHARRKAEREGLILPPDTPT